MPKETSNVRPYVLLTGSTGLVGSLVLARLLECEIPVAVLVRDSRRQSAASRLEGVVGRLEERFGRQFPRPVLVSGDLCQPGLGLVPGDEAWLSEFCGSVIHSAANLLFKPASEHPSNEPYRTNVGGTQNLLSLLSRVGVTEWHYVSTAYVAGLRQGRIFESECWENQEFGNDYERSKAQCERLLADASSVRSLTIYRPSIVIDLHSATNMRSDQTINSAFAMFQALSQRFGLPQPGEWFRRLGFSGHEMKNIVTVDWVSEMIAEIYRRPALHGRTYHLTCASGTSASTLENSFRAAVQQSNLKVPPLHTASMTQIDELASPFVAAFKPYFKDDPVFDRANSVEAMTACGVVDLPEITEKNLTDFCLRQTKPAPLQQQERPQTTAWERFVSRCQLPFDSRAFPKQRSQNLIGLELYGPGGGQWVIEETSRGFSLERGFRAGTSSRWFMSLRSLEELISGRVELVDAISSAEVIYELDCPVENQSELLRQQAGILSGALSWIRKGQFDSFRIDAEVTNAH